MSAPVTISVVRRWWLVAAMGAGLIALMLGCASRSRYEVLSFFFDGVPDPDAKPLVRPGEQATDNTPQKPTGPMASIHKPYADKQCAQCHKSTDQAGFEVSALDSKSCNPCHQDTAKAFPVMHTALNLNACLWCHSPHQSEHKHLLRETGAAICEQCHDPAVLTTTVKDHQAGKRSCLDCHYAHGGADRNLLKPVPTSMPTTGPSTKPARPARGRLTAMRDPPDQGGMP